MKNIKLDKQIKDKNAFPIRNDIDNYTIQLICGHLLNSV